MSDTLLPEAGYPSSPHQAPVCLQKWGLQTVGPPLPPAQTHPHEKAGDREEEWRAHAFSHRLLSLLLWCLDYLHRAKAKCIRRPGLCRNMGGWIILYVHWCEHCKGTWAGTGGQAVHVSIPRPEWLQGHAAHACPSSPGRELQLLSPLECENCKEVSLCKIPGFQDVSYCVSVLPFLIHQHPHLLQEWFLTSNSATYCSGPRFDHKLPQVACHSFSGQYSFSNCNLTK